MSPPENAIVLSVDEESQEQALDRTQPLLPLAPGQRAEDPRRRPPRDHVAVRGPERGHRRGDRQVLPPPPAAGVPQVPRRDRRADREGAGRGDPHRLGQLRDAYGTHKTPKVRRWFERHPEYHLHFTPTSGSKLNQVERSFAQITAKRIRRGAALEKAIMEYLARHNEYPRPFVWTAGADRILERVKKVCERISNSGH